MGKLELTALRRRARAAGISPGVLARAERARALDEGTREWCPLRRRYVPSAQTGLAAPSPIRLVTPTPIDFEGVQRWVVAICRPSMARSVGEDMPALGFRAYCPLGRRVIMRARGPGGTRVRRIHQWAVFGRYLFVGEMPNNPLAAYIHDAIVGIIGDSRGSWALNPEWLRERNAEELAGQWDYVGSSENPFKIGQSVRIADGHPFEHFVGIVTALIHEGAKIDLDMFGRPTTVSVPVRKLAAVV